MVPVFSQSAAFAAQHLADFGLEFDSVHVILRGYPDTIVIVKDTTIFFSSSGPDSLSLDLKIPIEAVRQDYSAGLDYKGPNGVVFHGGPLIVSSHPVNGPAPAGDSIRVNYVGPGHNVKAITISPKTVTLSGVASTAFTVSAIDSSGAPTTVPPLDWTSSNDALVTVSGSSTAGTAQSHGIRGSATITATSPSSISDNAVVAVVLPPASIAVVSGADQTGKAGSALPNPAVVQVGASDGVGVAGVNVTFAAPAGGGVGTATATTDANGRAQTTLKLGGATGAQAFSAQAGGFSATIGATATAGDAAAIAIVSGSGQTGTASAPLANPLVVKVTDTFGNAVSGAAVSWSRTSGSGALGAATSTTDAGGIASNTYTFGTTAGGENVSASIAGVSVSFVFTATAGAPAAIAIISGNGQTGGVNQSLASPFVVKVTDAGGNAVANATVSWSASNGTITPSSTTDASGQSSVAMTLSTTVGSASAVAKIANGQSVAFGATVTTGAVAQLVFTTQPSNTTANAVMSPVHVALRDAGGNATTSTNPVTIALGNNPSGATLTGTLTRNAVSGTATFDDLKLDRTGTAFTMVVTSGALTATSAAFNIGVGAATNLVIQAGDNQSATVGTAVATGPSVKVTDASNNPISGVVVTFAVASGGGPISPVSGQATTDASGIATLTSWTLGAAAGAQSLTASATGTGTVTFHATATAGAAGSIAIVAGDNQSAPVGTSVTTTPSVKITDLSNNPLSGVVVTFAVASGGGTLSPVNGQATTNASGIATLTSWTLGAAAGAQSLTASATGTGAVTFHATANAGAATTLVIQAGDNQSATVGTAVATGPSVKVTDASNNPISGVVVTFAVASGGGSISPINGQATTNASGIATLTSWTLGTTAGAQSLSASATGAGTVTFNATATPGAAGNITIVAGDNQTATVGTAVVTAPSVKITDASTNPVPGIVVTFAVASGGGTLSPVNGQATTNASGIATLTSWTLGTTAGAQSLTASATGTGSLTFHATATAGSASVITIVAGDNQSATVGTAVPTAPSVKVTDAATNPLSGVVVTFTVASGGGTISPVNGQATTNASGIATLTSWTLGTTAGAQTLSASATGTGSVTFHATANAGGADHIVITGSLAFVANAQSGTTSFPGTLPSVTVQDVSNNPVNGASVFWSLGTPCAAGFVLGTSPTTTNASGVATAPAITVPNGIAGSCVLLTSLTNSFSPTSNRFYTIMKPAAATAWLGTSSDTAWATASNWSSGSAPTSATTIFVPVAVPSPKLLADGSGGSITLESGSTNLRLNTHTLTASGDIVASGSGITNGTLTLNGTGTVNITGTLPTTNVGNGGSCGAFQLSGAASTGSITVNCPLTIGAQTLTVGGNFSTASATGVLVMTSAGGLVDVTGSSTFAGASEATFLTNGTFKARGNFAQSSAVSGASYAPSALHATSFAGASNQSVSFADPANSFFNDVDLSNGGVTTTFTTLVTVNHNLTANASANLVQSGAGKRIIVAGTVTANPSSNLGGVDSLRVTGTTFPIYNNTTVGSAPKVTQLTGAMVLTANRTVAGGLSIASLASLELAGHTLAVKDSIDVVGTLNFLSASSGGTLNVGGTFNIDGGTVTAQTGTLQLSGDFTENGTMAASAGFLTKLAGTSAQSVTFTHPSTTQSFFADLEIANTNVFGANFATNGVVTGTLTVDANSVLKTGAGLVLTAMGNVTSAGTSNMSGVAELVDSATTFPAITGQSPATTRLTKSTTMPGDATFTGNLIVQNTLDINTKKLTVKDFTVGTGGLLKMSAASDSVVVNGNAVFAGNSQDDFPFTAGAFDFKGNVTVSGTETFYVSNSTANTARFTSTSPQTISIGGTNNFFANVTLGSSSNVTFATDATSTGLLDLRTSAAMTVNAGTTLTVTTSDPAINFHNATIMHVNGTVAPTSLTCQRDISGATAPQMNGSGTFGSVSTIIPGSGPGTTIDSSCRAATLP